MKKNKIFALGLIVTFVAFISLSLVSSTWAKYTSSVSGTSTATVAKWSFDGVDLSTNTIDFNLFATILDTNGKEETDVKAGLIAPGTKGNASFTFKNTGEVNAKAIVKLELTNTSNIPLTFTLGEETLFADGNSYQAEITLDMNDTTGTTWELNWAWAFSGNDSTDTTLGTATTAPQVSVKLIVEFVQVD
ncbi:MAG: hypothetical protein NC182_06235 [Prevotella sp.]|nr:hypothetical protein [Staphylococcus sp.]MCM1350783.1 hypothetical protein [Prevotella sp.]